MKTKTVVMLALAVLGCLSALAANAFGVDVQTFAQTHLNLLSGLTYLCVGNTDYLGQITKMLEESNEDWRFLKTELSQRIEQLENVQAKGNRPGYRDGETKNFVYKGAKVDQEHDFKMMRNYLVRGDDTEMKALAISTSSGADGGYAMPKAIDAMIESLIVNISPIRTIANVVQVTTADYHKLVNQRGTASGWAAETGGRVATTTPTLADVSIKPFELYANPQASQQMLDDVYFNAEQWIADQLATEFGRAEAAAFVSGNGTTQPLGFLSGTPVSTADGVRTFGTLQYLPTGVSGAFPASNPADFLMALMYSLKQGYRQDATWVMNKATLSSIAQFKDTAGRYILTPVSQPGMPATIFGYPVVEAEDMPAVAANSFSLAFGNFKRGYEIVDRNGPTILRDPFSNKPFVGFYSVKRVGGAIVNSEAIKLAKFSVS